MDNRRLNTMRILDAGVTNINAPKGNAPDIEYEEIDDYGWTEDEIKRKLKNNGIKGRMYYGWWAIWKTDKKYSGELFQYRSITDEFENEDFEYAVEKAIEWATNCQG